MSNRRWVCPAGEHDGVLAPGRMRKDDIRRFCWPCSQVKGRLVERVAPSLEKEREDKATKRKERAKTAKKQIEAREAAKYTFDGTDMMKEFDRLKKLDCWKNWRVEKWIDRLELRLSRSKTKLATTGHHHNGRGYITVTGADRDSWYAVSLVILHEMVHESHFRAGKQRVTGRKTRAVHDAEFHDMLRVAAQLAYQIKDLFDLYRDRGGAGRAYSMDLAITHRLRERFGGRATPVPEPKKERPRPRDRIVDGVYTVELPSVAISRMNANDWYDGYFGGPGDPASKLAVEVEITLRRVGRGHVGVCRGKEGAHEIPLTGSEERAGIR